MTWNELYALFAFIGVCAAAATSGAVFKPGEWYDRLAKPAWVPPMWLFPVAWTLLYAMISVSGWMVWKQAGLAGASLAFVIYGLQLALNAGWSALFFGLRRIDLALVEVAALWASIVALIAAFAPHSSTAAWLLVPYLAWVSFAAYLNFVMLRLNPTASTAQLAVK
jgi:tryptophan-rich sensory protein